MSLLMEALKRAERSKQGQTAPHAEQPGWPGSAAKTPNLATALDQGLSLLPQKKDAGHPDTVGSSNFPPITATQETPPSTQDLAPPPQDTPPIQDLAPQADESQNAAPTRIEPTIAPALEPPLAEPPPSRWTSASPAPVATPDIEPEARPQDIKKIAAAQQKAKTVFSAKQPPRNRTLLLAGAAAAIMLGLASAGVYYYWQITFRTQLLPASTPQPASVAAPAAPVEAGAPQQQEAPATAAQNLADKPVMSPIETPAVAPVRPPPAPTAVDPARAETRSAPEPFKENPAIRIRQSAAAAQLDPALGKAYQSFLSGDTGTAQSLYQKVLQHEPNNRDALLGMAAIALKQRQAGQAAAYYSKLLDLDPADPEALAGLIGLQGQSDPTQSESRLKKILAQNPQADAAHFALGNLYTQQSRWNEAQQAYFRAYSSAPGNADYAFNLAVSLDHLNQSKLALDYYQRALAQPGPANFDKSAAQTRINELQQAAGN